MSSARTTIGTIIKDNDPRMENRPKLKIAMVDYPHAFCRYFGPFSSQRLYRIKLSSIHEDGKPRRSGFSVIQKGPEQ